MILYNKSETIQKIKELRKEYEYYSQEALNSHEEDKKDYQLKAAFAYRQLSFWVEELEIINKG